MWDNLGRIWALRGWGMRGIRVALAQINSTVGDLDGNAEKIIHYVDLAREAGADLVAFPELAVTGYPPEDLLLKPSFIRDNLAALERIVAASQGYHRRGRLRGRRRRHLQRRGRHPRRRAGLRLPQGVPAQLRGLRRGALLPAGGGAAGLPALAA